MLKQLTRTILTVLVLSVGLLATGCSSSDNPVAPTVPDDGGQEVIRTPKTLKITSVWVRSFGEKNGGSWDFSTTVSKRRPDVYMQLRGGTRNNAPFYVSEIVDDAFTGVRYTFIKSGAGVGLPKNHSASRTLYLELMDDDGLSSDDYMGGKGFKPLDFYKNDNATAFSGEFTGTNGTLLGITGTWIY